MKILLPGEDYGMRSGPGTWLSQCYHLPPTKESSWLYVCCCGWSRRFYDSLRMARSTRAHNPKCPSRKEREGARTLEGK